MPPPDEKPVQPDEDGHDAGAAVGRERPLRSAWVRLPVMFVLPIGLHLGWSLAEGGIFGTTVSGAAGGPASLFQAAVTGPQALTGGDFGPEAGIIAIVVSVIPTVLFLMSAKRRGRFYTRRHLPAVQRD
jgi:hypothetical protein